jgi:hypothetical protein
MEVYVAWSDGYWCAFSLADNTLQAKAWLYHVCRAKCVELGLTVVAVRRRVRDYEEA